MILKALGFHGEPPIPDGPGRTEIGRPLAEPGRTPTPFVLSAGAHATFQDAPDAVVEFKPGDVIADQFDVVRVLGRGGMGIVYEVRDRLTRQRLALKAILPGLLLKPEAAERFVQEVNTARRLRHPGIVGVYDVRRIGPLLFFTVDRDKDPRTTAARASAFGCREIRSTSHCSPYAPMPDINLGPCYRAKGSNLPM